MRTWRRSESKMVHTLSEYVDNEVCWDNMVHPVKSKCCSRLPCVLAQESVIVSSPWYKAVAPSGDGLEPPRAKATSSVDLLNNCPKCCAPTGPI
jgi:hypothetical protein